MILIHPPVHLPHLHQLSKQADSVFLQLPCIHQLLLMLPPISHTPFFINELGWPPFVGIHKVHYLFPLVEPPFILRHTRVLFAALLVPILYSKISSISVKVSLTSSALFRYSTILAAFSPPICVSKLSQIIFLWLSLRNEDIRARRQNLILSNRWYGPSLLSYRTEPLYKQSKGCQGSFSTFSILCSPFASNTTRSSSLPLSSKTPTLSSFVELLPFPSWRDVDGWTSSSGFQGIVHPLRRVFRGISKV